MRVVNEKTRRLKNDSSDDTIRLITPGGLYCILLTGLWNENNKQTKKDYMLYIILYLCHIPRARSFRYLFLFERGR